MAIASYDKCVLLLPMNGANNGTVFKEYSLAKSPVIGYGGASIKTDQSKFYGSSGYFNGSTSYLATTKSIKLGNKKFTIGLWVKTTSATHYTCLMTQPSSYSFTSGAWALFFNPGASNGRLQLYVSDYNDSVPMLAASSGNVADGAWHYIEVSRGDNNLWSLWLDGVSVASLTSSITIVDLSTSFYISGDANFGGRGYAGYLQDFFIVQDVALHTANFPVPGSLMGTIANSGSGIDCIRDAKGDPAIRTVQAISRAGEFITTAQSDVQGRYSMFVPAVEHNVLLLDSEDKYNDLLIGKRVMPV